MTTSTLTRKHVRAGTALSLAVAAAIGAGPAWAAPVQPGTGPGQSGPEQGGTAPSSPQQPGTAPSVPETPAPTYNPGPGLIPSPPQGDWAPNQPAPETAYPQVSYNPIPTGPIHAPRPTAPVQRKAPPPDHVRVGNFVMPVKDLPNLPVKNSDRDKAVVSINEWSAYAEAEIARGLISIGVPEDEATRQAAAAMIGIAAGGGIGFAVGFTATALLVGPIAIPIATGIGCGVGMSMGASPVSIAAGCGIGFAAGTGITLAAATAAGAGTGLAGAVGGGIVAWLLGAGDKNAHPDRPGLPWDKRPENTKPALPNPDGNQFQVVLAPSEATQAGLPAVEYTVNRVGDVNLQVGSTEIGWSAAQAQAPIKALGGAAPIVEKAINDTTKSVSAIAATIVPALDVTWPQEEKKSSSTGGKHRRN